jgi:hypothetical protein
MFPKMAGHLGENLGAEAALIPLILGTMKRHAVHLSYIKLNNNTSFLNQCCQTA